MIILTKYHSNKTKCAAGHIHDSKKEAARCNELTMLEKSGKIKNLRQQVRFELIPPTKYTDMPNERACVYIADFVYFKDGVMFVEDTKGFKTPEYIIKRKLFKQKYCKDRYCGNLIIFKEL